MNVKLRRYKYCYSNLGAIYARGFMQWAIERVFRLGVSLRAGHLAN